MTTGRLRAAFTAMRMRDGRSAVEVTTTPFSASSFACLRAARASAASRSREGLWPRAADGDMGRSCSPELPVLPSLEDDFMATRQGPG